MSNLRVIGIDPGPQPGLVLLRFGISTPWWPVRDMKAVQCDAATAPDILHLLLAADSEDSRTIVGCESFVRSSRSSRLRHAGGASVTERMIKTFDATVAEWFDHEADGSKTRTTGNRWTTNNAARVKRWAVYERLDKAGLLEATVGMTHARDAAKHAMFVACEFGGAPDPLSRKAHR